MTFTIDDYQRLGTNRAEFDAWLEENELLGEFIFEFSLTDDPTVIAALCYAKNEQGSRYLVAADGSPWVHHDKRYVTAADGSLQPAESDPVAATVRKTFAVRTPPPEFVANYLQ